MSEAVDASDDVTQEDVLVTAEEVVDRQGDRHAAGEGRPGVLEVGDDGVAPAVGDAVVQGHVDAEEAVVDPHEHHEVVVAIVDCQSWARNVWLWLCGCGCVAVWMYGCGCMAVWMYGCMAVWMYGCMALWLYGCMDVWLYG